MTKKLILCLSVLFLVILCLSVWARSAKAQTPISYSTKVTATIPAWWWLELTGWTSPFASVELTMQDVIKRITQANETGQFNFKIALPRVLAPFCLMATDVSNISSHPLCLAPPPLTEDVLIKEVVMPPTLSLSKGKMLQGETVAAQGYTTPDSEVVPYLFEENKRVKEREGRNFYSSTLSFFHSVYAAEVPKPPVKSDQNGFYQFNLPTSEIGKNRVFVGSIFLSNPSPKSTTLVFNVLNWWKSIMEKIIAFLANLLFLLIKYVTSPEGIILVEIGIVLVLLYLIISSFKNRRKPVALKDLPPEELQF